MKQPMPLFDALAAWNAMTAEQQAEIGVAAIIFAIGDSGEQLGRPFVWGFGAAAQAGYSALIVGVENATGGDLGGLPRPSLDPLGVTACRLCGCTQDCACPGGCSWAEPNLCSRCAGIVADLKARHDGARPDAGPSSAEKVESD